MKSKTIPIKLLNLLVAIIMVMGLGFAFSPPVSADEPPCVNPQCIADSFTVCAGTTFDLALITSLGHLNCSPAPGTYDVGLDTEYTISMTYDFDNVQPGPLNGQDLEGQAPPPGVYTYHVTCLKDRLNYLDCGCFSVAYITVVDCQPSASDFDWCLGETLTEQDAISNGNVACTGSGCSLVDVDLDDVDTDTLGSYEYFVTCNSATCGEVTGSAFVNVVSCEEACCDCYAPDMMICQGDELTEQDIIDAGADCGTECTPTIDISGVDTDEPGDYTYTVMCEGTCGSSECTGTVTVVPACVASAPDFSVCQFASEGELEAAAIKAGAECSAGCDPDFDFHKVHTDVPEVYEYCISCENPCVDGCPSGCGDDEACGWVTVIPCMDVEIIECPESDYPNGVVPVSTQFVVKAAIDNCSECILSDVVAHIEICEGADSVELLDPASWPLGNMGGYDSTEVSWNLHCTGPGEVKVKVYTTAGGEATCGEDECEFRQAEPAGLSATITAPCEVCTDCTLNTYQVCATVTNNGDCPVEFVEATLTVLGGTATREGVANKDVTDLLGPGQSAPICWTVHCTGEGAATFQVVFNGIDQCDHETVVMSSVVETTTEQRNVLVDIECVKGLEAGQTFTNKTDFTPACDSSCLSDPTYHPGDCDHPDAAMYDVVSTLQPFSVKAKVQNCQASIKSMDVALVVPAGTQLYPGSWVKVYSPLSGVTWVAAAPVIHLDPVCACCYYELTWILQCTASSEGDELPIEVTVASGGKTYSSMCCNPAYVIQEAKVHLNGSLALYVEDCDSECMVAVDAVTMCQDYDVKVCVTNEGEADAYDLSLDLVVEGDSTCTGTYSDIQLGNFPDINGDTWSTLCGGETHCYWLSTLIDCSELQCTSIDDVTITLLNLDGYDENTCQHVLEANIEDVCPLVITQPNVWVEIVNPDLEECNDVKEYEVFTVKAQIFNCGPYDLEDVTATLCWTTDDGKCRNCPEVELVEGSVNPKLIPLIAAPNTNCCETGGECQECQPTVYEVSWMVRCLCEGDVSFSVCLEAANPHLQVHDLGLRTGTQEVTNPCCLTCADRASLYTWPVTVHQEERQKAKACVDIVSPDIGAKYATGQEFAVTAIIQNNECCETLYIDRANLKVGKQFFDISLGDGVDVASETMPPLPWVIAPGESKTVTFTVQCTESGLTWFKVKLSGETDLHAPVWEESDAVWVWQYPAAHLEVNINEYPEQPIVTSTIFPVTAMITNTGEADATEVYATISVLPEGSVRVAGPSDDGYTKFIGTIPGHGSESNSVPVTWNLQCKVPCDSTIKITLEGADEYGYHFKQECANTGSFMVESGIEIIEGLVEGDPDVNKGWFTGYFIGDANGLTGPFSVDTPISWAAVGGGPDFTGHMVGMGSVLSNIPPEIADFLSFNFGCCGDRTCVGADLMTFVGHVVTDDESDILPPWGVWDVSPGMIQVINGTVTGLYDIEPMVDGDGQLSFIISLLGGTYCTNLAAEPGRAIQAAFIESDEVTVKQLDMLADLAIEKISNTCCYTMGEVATFSITLNNLGPSDATSILVRDILPADLGFEGFTASQGWYDETSGYWSVGDLEAGESAALQIQAKVNTVGEVCNRATVVSLDQHDPVTTNDMDEACINADEAEPTDEVTLDLDNGLNLISLPLIPNNLNNPQTELADDNAIVVYMYDKSTEGWVSYTNGNPPGGFPWRDGLGYWINMASPATDLTINGVDVKPYPSLPPSYEVFGKDGINYFNGWNLIGFKSTIAKSPAEYLAGIAGDYVMIYGYDNGAFFAVGAPGHTMLQPGLGYWLAIRDGKSGTIFP